jgi:biopolymer transport protein ExbD
MRINLGEDEQPEIGLIALIDCIFFLLMFFMVATSFKQQTEAKKEKELAITLPVAAASFDQKNASSPPLVIGIDKSGKIYLAGEKVSIQTLHDRLSVEAAKNPKRNIRIDGDEMASYKNIVHVLDLCQFEGFTNIAMHTRNR